MKNKKILVGLLSTSTIAMVAPTIASCANVNTPVDPVNPLTPVQKEIFDIEGDTLKGFKSSATKQMIKDYCKGGVLRLPAVKTIGANAFSEPVTPSPFGTTIEIPASVTEIGDRAFYGNTATSITWSGTSQLKTIGEAAFANCKGLTEFKFPASMWKAGSSVKKNAFIGCSNITYIDANEAAYGFDIDQWEAGSLAGLKTSGGTNDCRLISSAGAGASWFGDLWTRLVFHGLSPKWNTAKEKTGSLSSVAKRVPTEYFIVDENSHQITGTKLAFTDDFQEAVLPKEVTDLTGAAAIFTSKPSIKSWHLWDANITSIPANFLKDVGTSDDTSVYIAYTPTSETSQVTSIGASAFENCKWKIHFGNKLTSKITSIGANAFKNATIASGDTTTGAYWTFNKNVTKVGDNAFDGTTGLRKLDFSNFDYAIDDPDKTIWGDNVFLNCNADGDSGAVVLKTYTDKPIDQWCITDGMVTFLKGRGLTFDSTTKWVQPLISDLPTYDQILDVDNSTVLKGWKKLDGGKGLSEGQLNKILSTQTTPVTTLTIPSTIQTIDDGAFYANPKSTIPSCITTIDLSSTNLTTIGNWTFDSLPATVEQLILPNSITEIYPFAFNKLPVTQTDLHIPTSITSIYKGAFQNFSNSIETIDFTNHTSLTSIYDSAFLGQDGSKLTKVDFTGCTSLAWIGEASFKNNKNLTSITLWPAPSSGTVSVGESAFYGAGSNSSGLTLTMPYNDTTSIQFASEAFAGSKINTIDMSALDFSEELDVEVLKQNWDINEGFKNFNKDKTITGTIWVKNSTSPDAFYAIQDFFKDEIRYDDEETNEEIYPFENWQIKKK